MPTLHVGAVLFLVLTIPTGADRTAIDYSSILVRAFVFLSRTLMVDRWAQDTLLYPPHVPVTPVTPTTVTEN
jgi:hypothetical protein